MNFFSNVAIKYNHFEPNEIGRMNQETLKKGKPGRERPKINIDKTTSLSTHRWSFGRRRSDRLMEPRFFFQTNRTKSAGSRAWPTSTTSRRASCSASKRSTRSATARATAPTSAPRPSSFSPCRASSAS